MSRPAAITDLSRILALHLLFLGLFTWLLPATAAAHELRPAIVTATIDKAGGVDVRASLNLEAWLAGIGSEHKDTALSDKAPLYEHLRESAPSVLEEEVGKSRDMLAGGLKLTADTASVGLDLRLVEVPPVGDVSLARTSTLVLKGVLPAGASSHWGRWEQNKTASSRFRSASPQSSPPSSHPACLPR